MRPKVSKPCLLIGPINAETTDECVKSLWTYALDPVEGRDPTSSPISLLINSEGGEVPCGWAIVETIREIENSCGVSVDTYAMGECASIAVVVFLCATGSRIATKSCSFMVHDLVVENASGNPDALGRLTTAMHWMNDSIFDYMQRKTQMDTDLLRNMMEEDVHFTAAEAVQLGFADQLR